MQNQLKAQNIMLEPILQRMDLKKPQTMTVTVEMEQNDQCIKVENQPLQLRYDEANRDKHERKFTRFF